MICNGQKINQIRFDHKGLNITFRCILEDKRYIEEIIPDEMMYLQFEDMTEVETLIRLLEDF